MSGRKRGSGADLVYANHLYGTGPMQSNPTVDREGQFATLLGRVIAELAMNRFKWTGFPESVDTRFIEICLLYQGLAVAYWDKDYDQLLVVRGSGTGYVNMVGNPVSFMVIGPGVVASKKDDTGASVFYNKMLSAYRPETADAFDKDELKKKAVPIWSNYLRYPDIDIVHLYATRLATLDRTLEINSKAARRNKVLTVPPNMQLSALNITRMIDEGSEAIQVSGSSPLADMQWLQAIDLGVNPDSYDKLSILRTRIWNECMGLLGIDNANQDKKERLVADEVSANDAQTDSMRFVSLNARRQAADYINDVFGLNVEVDFNTEIEAKAQAVAAQQGINTESDSDNG